MRSYFLLPYSLGSEHLGQVGLNGVADMRVGSRVPLKDFAGNGSSRAALSLCRTNLDEWRFHLSGHSYEDIFVLLCAVKLYAYIWDSVVGFERVTLMPASKAHRFIGKKYDQFISFEDQKSEDEFREWFDRAIPFDVSFNAIIAIGEVFVASPEILHASENLLVSLEGFRGDVFAEKVAALRRFRRTSKSRLLTIHEQLSLRPRLELSFLASFRAIECILHEPFIKRNTIQKTIERNRDRVSHIDPVQLLYRHRGISKKVGFAEWLEFLLDLRNEKAGHGNFKGPRAIDPYILTDLQRFIGNWIIKISDL